MNRDQVPFVSQATSMATALVGSPTAESRAEQERQFSRHEDGLQREVESPDALQATKEMCAYCFGA